VNSRIVDGEVPSRRIVGLCALATRTTAIDGAAAVLDGRSGHRILLGSVGELSAPLQEYSSVLGEGPDVDAAARGRPVVVDHLDTNESWLRWPIFTGEALRLGITAIVALPMRIGAISLGVFVGYRAEPGAIAPEELVGLPRIADTAAYMILDLSGSAEAAGDRTPVPASRSVGFVGMEIHQASGMVMVQLGIPIETALVRLRAYAFTHERLLGDVARDVLARKLDLRDDSGENNGRQ
jgi:hypothetical protein